MEPLVSVIMNCYNGERYLREAIASVINQTYTNWELVFWDNQSTDSSAAIVAAFDESRVRYFRAPTHTLLYEARSYAMRHARGDLIAFLDVDDWWLPEKLARQVHLFDDPDVGIVCGNYWVVNERKNLPRQLRWRRPMPEGRPLNELLERNFVGMLTLMVRRTAYEGLEYGCDARYHIIGDFDLVVRLLLDWTLRCVQEPVACCRLHDHNETIYHRERAIHEIESWTAEMGSKYSIIACQPGFRTLLQSIRYDYGRLHVLRRRRVEALKDWWLLPWGMFKLKLLADILIPLSSLSWKLE